MPLGDEALLVRFADNLDEEANRRAISFARLLEDNPVPGMIEIVPNLVSVLVRYTPANIRYHRLAGEIRLRLGQLGEHPPASGESWTLEAELDGPDLDDVATSLNLSRDGFIKAHNQTELRVLAVGFAPGFLYCGMHPENLIVPRRKTVRPKVPRGTILFAAGQTAITATSVPTGWHVIGHTDFINFDPQAEPPVRIRAGDRIGFSVAPAQ
ncbi:MAG: allophanate hydrolase subunit 1 [Hyphomicrobiaceae bacterium]|nr:allophanate hydrolase subunit 1 [Hyphomicrobiaceae bacterium]